MKINYVIATYNSKGKRNHNNPLPENILKCHLENIILYSSIISQITIMCAKSDNYYKNYYDLDDIINKTTIPIKIIKCENFAMSMGQWFKAYELFKDEFDYYIFIEDDYCPGMRYYDKILFHCYRRLFNDKKIGVLCSAFSRDGYNRLAPHFEGVVLLNKETLEKLYNNTRWQGNPRKYLDLIDDTVDPRFSWNLKSLKHGYYQVSFSHLFTLSGIDHKDYLNITYNNRLLQFPYWEDYEDYNIGGKITFYNNNGETYPNKKIYTINEILNSPIIPIQLRDKKSIIANTNLFNKSQKTISSLVE